MAVDVVQTLSIQANPIDNSDGMGLVYIKQSAIDFFGITEAPETNTEGSVRNVTRRSHSRRTGVGQADGGTTIAETSFDILVVPRSDRGSGGTSIRVPYNNPAMGGELQFYTFSAQQKITVAGLLIWIASWPSATPATAWINGQRYSVRDYTPTGP